MKRKINIYTCGGPRAKTVNGVMTIVNEPEGHSTVTIDRQEGVTPMFMDCPICGKTAKSNMYRVDQSLIPSHEWYKPTEKETDALELKFPGMKAHIENGGLDIREIQNTEPDEITWIDDSSDSVDARSVWWIYEVKAPEYNDCTFRVWVRDVHWEDDEDGSMAVWEDYRVEYRGSMMDQSQVESAGCPFHEDYWSDSIREAVAGDLHD